MIVMEEVVATGPSQRSRRASTSLRVSPVVAVVAVLAAAIAALPLLYLAIQASSRGLGNVIEEVDLAATHA